MTGEQATFRADGRRLEMRITGDDGEMLGWLLIGTTELNAYAEMLAVYANAGVPVMSERTVDGALAKLFPKGDLR